MSRDFIEVSLSDEKFFDLFIGKRILKKDIRNNDKNLIPVYSANPLVPFGHVRESNITVFDSDFVIWGIDGKFEFNIMRKGEKFATTDHCGAIRIKDTRILPEYLCYVLTSLREDYGFDRGLRASIENMKEVTVDLPVQRNALSDPEIDMEFQNRIAKKFNKIIQIRSELIGIKEVIVKSSVNIEEELLTDVNYKEVSLSDESLFILKKGNSKFTMEYIDKHRGNYPIYTAQTANNGNAGYIDSFEFDAECIQWTTNGARAGTLFHRAKHKFSINGDAALLILNTNEIDYGYIVYELNKEFLTRNYGWENKPGIKRVKDVSIKIPTNAGGLFDLQKQKEISKKYEKMEDIKSKLINGVDKLIGSTYFIKLK